MFIEHRGGLWQLKPALAKGKDSGWADCAGGCALEACTSRIWNMDLGKAGAPAWTVTPSSPSPLRCLARHRCSQRRNGRRAVPMAEFPRAR
jgi:hypothetical protein